ncbi:MAG: PD40 domain-containing protein [Thermosipho sp. (in: Bacteria)]|nr:PD40 domain-containing protein [Thermosipho sp. (in: thermotogales)]
MRRGLIMLAIFFSVVISFSIDVQLNDYTIGVVTSLSTETYEIFEDAKMLLYENLEYGNVIFLNAATEATCNEYVYLYLSYNATDNIYKATYEDGEYFVSSIYSPKGYKRYKTFLMEIIYYPLEKLALHRLKTGDFSGYLRLTYYPGIDEYGDYSNRLFLFISDRLGGNRNVTYFDIDNEKIKILPVFGSSEYYPKFSPDGEKIAFQGSLHGFWNIYIMPFNDPNYSKKIKKISNANLPAYTPEWFDNENILYIQDIEKGNMMIKKNIYSGYTETINTVGTMAFTPRVYNNEIYYTSLQGANFGIYKNVENENYEVEDTFYNEHDPLLIDATHLVFTSNRDGIYRIWLKNLETGSVTCLTPDLNYDVFYPAFGDGILFFSLYKDEEEPDIYALKLNLEDY